MNQSYSLKIDIFPHILPMKYKEALEKTGRGYYLREAVDNAPTLYNMEHRFRIMDKYPGLVQVLNVTGPPVESVAGAEKAVELAKVANDAMAELVAKYPDKFVGAVACLPWNTVDSALAELDRAINDLRFRGVQIFSTINDKPLDSPEFMPFYEKMCQYNLPILIHPKRSIDHADYKAEDKSRYRIFSCFGWPYETTAAMARLALSGILETYPNLKIVTHHCGGMVPYFEGRIRGSYDGYVIKGYDVGLGDKSKRGLTKPPIDYFKLFYNDTAVYGSAPALMCAYAFCGASHLLFGTDMPYDNQHGDRYTRETINSIEQMAISDSEKKMIFEDNARRLFRLPI